jgi:hypothetical protein
LTISIAKALTSRGFSAANSGLKPLKRTVRSRAGWVCRSGMVPCSVRARLLPAPSDSSLRQRDVPLAHQVAVADQRPRALRQRAVGVHGERHPRERPTAALGNVDAVDLADANAGDPDVVTPLQAGRVGEQRVVGRGAAEADVADRGGEHAGGEHRHDREDDELDERGGGLHD